MRVDLLLKKLCLAKSRSQAQQACVNKLVVVNGKTVEASHRVREGDVVELKLPGRAMKIKLMRLPEGQLSRKSAVEYYHVLDTGEG